MAIVSETEKILRDLLSTSDKEIEASFEDLKTLLEEQSAFDQAVIEKTAYCRANNLTEDDLIEENSLAGEALAEQIKDLSPTKQKLLGYLFGIAARVNNHIIEKGLFPIVKVRVERLPHNEKLPAYAHENGDSGLDVYLTEDISIEPRKTLIAKIGIKVAIPIGYELQVRPRSGISLKIQDLFVANSPGTIDAGYREEVGILLKNIGEETLTFTKGTKIAQLVLAPVIKLEWVEVDDINDFPSDRKGGFGHTGDK